MKKYLIVPMLVLLNGCSAAPTSGDKETQKSKISQGDMEPPKWKVIKIESLYKDNITQEVKDDYQGHLDLMVDYGYIMFLTDSTFEGHNGIFEMEGTYQIVGDTLFTKNAYGFQSNYFIKEFTEDSLIYQSVQDELTITIYHAKETDSNEKE